MHDPQRDVLYDYYTARAPIYDGGYTGVPQPWVDTMIHALQTALSGRRVLELACGTGHWTSYAAEVARSIMATDIAPAMLARARDKLRAHPNVTVAAADAYELEQIAGDFTAGLAMQWFSHIPIAQLMGFLAHWHARLGPGAVVFMADNQRRADDSDPLISIPGDPNTYEIRTLPDRRQYTIIKNYYTAEELRTLLEPAAEELQITIGQRWWWLSYRVAAPAS
jgi:SAM-dependent methyltransferase